MKNRLKIFTIILLIILSFVMIACDIEQDSNIANNLINSYTNTEEIDNEENKTNEDSFANCQFYQDYFSTGLLEEMSNNKNKDYEMEVGIYETEDEMLEEYFKTFLLIVCDFYDVDDNKIKTNAGSGNIYDIDDEYMYIITCVHITRNKKSDELQKITIRFVDDTLLELEPDYLITPNNDIDIALIKIPLSLINESTLSIVKTINISHAYTGSLSEFENSILYCYRFRQHKYEVSYVHNMENTIYGFSCKDNNINDGTSGGGIIDKDGNYYAPVLKEGSICPEVLFHFNELLKENQ